MFKYNVEKNQLNINVALCFTHNVNNIQILTINSIFWVNLLFIDFNGVLT